MKGIRISYTLESNYGITRSREEFSLFFDAKPTYEEVKAALLARTTSDKFDVVRDWHIVKGQYAYWFEGHQGTDSCYLSTQDSSHRQFHVQPFEIIRHIEPVKVDKPDYERIVFTVHAKRVRCRGDVPLGLASEPAYHEVVEDLGTVTRMNIAPVPSWLEEKGIKEPTIWQLWEEAR